MIPALLAKTRPAAVIIVSPRIVLRTFARWSSSHPPCSRPFKSSSVRNLECATPTRLELDDELNIRLATAEIVAPRQTNAVLIRDERDARPFPDDTRDFRARFSKVHKR